MPQPYTPTPHGPTGAPVPVPRPVGPGGVTVDPELARRQREIELQRQREADVNPAAIARRIGRSVGDVFGGGGGGPAVPLPETPHPPGIPNPPGVGVPHPFETAEGLARMRTQPVVRLVKDVIEFVVEYGPTGIRYLDAPGYVLTTPSPLGNDVYYQSDPFSLHGGGEPAQIQPHNAGKQDP